MSFTGGISSNQLTGAILLIFATVELVLNAADDSRDYPERMVRLRELSRLASLIFGIKHRICKFNSRKFSVMGEMTLE